MGETPSVSMVRRADNIAFFEPAGTRQQWKGEAAASLVCTGITSGRALPTSSAGYWSPSLSCPFSLLQAPPKRRDPSGVFFFRKTLLSQFELLLVSRLKRNLKTHCHPERPERSV